MTYTTSNVLSGSKNPNPFLSCPTWFLHYMKRTLRSWGLDRQQANAEGSVPRRRWLRTDTTLFQFLSCLLVSLDYLRAQPHPSPHPHPPVPLVGGAPWLSKLQDALERKQVIG